MERAMRVCLAASAGGHASELMRLQSCWEGWECFAVVTSEVVAQQWARFGRVYVVAESNRQHPLRVLRTLAGCLCITLRERPAVILSTGAVVGCLMALLGKLRGARIVWIDSMANMERRSLSGRLVRPCADLVLTQWPEVAKQYRRVEYAGHIV
jgi:UDP-N-acetylglucosamine:LPS N-acetylglucosamine transferase